VNQLYATSGRDGATAYHRAVQAADKPSCLSLLLTAEQAAVNVQDSAGFSPLHLAFRLNHKTTAKKLLVPNSSSSSSFYSHSRGRSRIISDTDIYSAADQSNNHSLPIILHKITHVL